MQSIMLISISMDDRTKMTGEWLSYCSACPVPEIANVFKRAGIRFHQITGMLDSNDQCWNEIGEWVEAAKVANTMSHNRLGAWGIIIQVCWIYTQTLLSRYATFRRAY